MRVLAVQQQDPRNTTLHHWNCKRSNWTSSLKRSTSLFIFRSDRVKRRVIRNPRIMSRMSKDRVQEREVESSMSTELDVGESTLD